MSIIKDSIYGFVIGDALGVPVEFRSRNELDRNPVIQMLGYGTYSVPSGCWSDDTSMTLATIDSIIEKDDIDYEDIMYKFCEWYTNSKYTANGIFFDIGNSTLNALQNYIKGIPPLFCGGIDERSNGNGSLMRMLPIVLYANFENLSETQSVKLINNISSLTHRHEVSKLGCKIYFDFVSEIIKGATKYEALKKLMLIDYSKYYSNSVINKYSRLLSNEFLNLSRDQINSSGYIVDTLEATLWCVINSNDYKSSVLNAVNLGNDTDTIAAITGSISGIIYGLDAIPKNWIEQIINRDYIERLACDFEKKLSCKNCKKL